jgi:HK97 gp10 family phage protein
MNRIRVSVENIQGFDAQFLEVVAAIEGKEEVVASVIESSAKSTAAFIDRTGNLRASIKKRKSKFENGGFIVEASGRGKSKGYHAANVEFGHVMIAWGRPTGKRVPPHPFMRPAAEEGIRKAVEVFREK